MPNFLLLLFLLQPQRRFLGLFLLLLLHLLVLEELGVKALLVLGVDRLRLGGGAWGLGGRLELSNLLRASVACFHFDNDYI